MEGNEFEYVGFWVRVGAAIVDSLIIMVITVPLLLSIYGSDYWFDPEAPFISGPGEFLISWVFPAVATILFWLYKRATPGKMVVSAQVVDATTGDTLTVGQSIGRYLAYFLATLPLCLGIIWVAFDPRKQGWHDKLAGTVVVRKKDRRPEAVSFRGS